MASGGGHGESSRTQQTRRNGAVGALALPDQYRQGGSHGTVGIVGEMDAVPMKQRHTAAEIVEKAVRRQHGNVGFTHERAYDVEVSTMEFADVVGHIQIPRLHQPQAGLTRELMGRRDQHHAPARTSHLADDGLQVLALCIDRNTERRHVGPTLDEREEPQA